jgi:Tyrosyl-DNA phosphodiesterase
MIIALPAKKGEGTDETDRNEENAKKPIGWAYIGSHNFTASAWGEMTGKPLFPKLKVCFFFFLRPGGLSDSFLNRS